MTAPRQVVFAEDMSTARLMRSLNPELRRAILLTPRRVANGAHRGAAVDEVHLFGTVTQMMTWSTDLLNDGTVWPMFATASDPVFVLHLFLRQTEVAK